jgi:hypothetical protein
VIPFIGSHNAKAGFVDTGQDMRDPDSHVYISVEAIEEMARFIGWEPATARVEAEKQASARTSGSLSSKRSSRARRSTRTRR